MRFITFFLLVLLPLFLPAEIRSGTGQWRAEGRAKVLYDTALGKLYQLQPNPGDGSFIGCRPAHEDYASCQCEICRKGRIRITGVLSLKLPPKVKITAKTRYVALDFRIRVYPALEKKSESRLSFALLDSQTPILGSMHFDLHGRKDIRDYCQDDTYYSHLAPMSTTRDGNRRIVSRDNNHFRAFIHPAFEPLSLRVVYDLLKKKMTYFMNGREFEYPAKIHTGTSGLLLRHFGIVTYENSHSAEERDLRKRYFEVSPPLVHVYDYANELPEPPQFSAYPYNSSRLENLSRNSRAVKAAGRSVREEFNQVRKHKNPDLQYAYALRYLYGQKFDADPGKGVELLNQAAKKHHASALYQLGICFLRGYGCRPDNKKAAGYLDRAADLGHPEAAAARLQLVMEQHGRPWFLAELYHKHLARFPQFARGHDEHYFRTSGEFLSPKRLRDWFTVTKMFRPDNPKQNYLEYRLQANDPFSFLAQALFLNSGKDPFFKRGERYLERALKVKHFEAYPLWLLCRLYRNKLPEKEKIPLEMRLLHADDPLFDLVYELLCLPETERLNYLRKMDGELRFRPLKDWKMKTPESEYLRAMMHCMSMAYRPDLCLSSGFAVTDKDHKQRQKIFDRILASAEAKYAPAQYLIGKFYYYADLPEPRLSREAGISAFRLSTAERFLTAAAEQGHLPAILLLCKLKMNSDFPSWEKILPWLDILCARKIPEAFYLKAEVLLKMNRKPEALAAADQAIEAGEHRGLLILIRNDNRANASALRHDRQLEYIRADRARRRQDPRDPYWDEPYGEYLKWISASSMKVTEKPAPPLSWSVTGNAGTNSSRTTGKTTRSSSKKEKSKGKSKIRFRDE